MRNIVLAVALVASLIALFISSYTVYRLKLDLGLKVDGEVQGAVRSQTGPMLKRVDELERLAALTAVQSAIDKGVTGQLQTLTGVLEVNAKDPCQYLLVPDGHFSHGLTIRGEQLITFNAGDHVLVRGVIKTGLMRQQADGIGYQGLSYWDIYMAVSEISYIEKACQPSDTEKVGKNADALVPHTPVLNSDAKR